MQRLMIEDGKGTADVGDYFLEMTVEKVGEDEESLCIEMELLGVDNCWYARASVNPDSIHELIEALQLIANHFGLERPKESLFAYNGEPGTA